MHFIYLIGSGAWWRPNGLEKGGWKAVRAQVQEVSPLTEQGLLIHFSFQSAKVRFWSD